MTRQPSSFHRRQSIVLATVLLGMQATLVVAQATSPTQPTDSPHAPVRSGFTLNQTKAILSLGPWPYAWKPDPSNRVSGNPDGVALGRSLFFDARLSGQGTHACSSCHRPEMAWQDGKTVGEGLAKGRRNTPSLFNVRYRQWFGWDGAADSLWAQSIRPILDPREMGASAEHVRAHIAGDLALASVYLGLFKRAAETTPAEDVLADAAKALAAYQETLVSPRTPFDEFRDALVRGDTEAASRYPAAAQRGLALFVDKAGCARCHGGATFAFDQFRFLSAPPLLNEPSRDLGRFEGVEQLLKTPYSLRSRFNDKTNIGSDWQMLVGDHNKMRGAFRVPVLRHVKGTAPYMHDGSVATLAEAVAHRVPAAQFWKSDRRKLTAAEIVDLVSFLETLSLP